MSSENHKIDADDRNIYEVLNGRKYTVDYFQREYNWQKKHIEQLVTDLTSAFLQAYRDSDKREAVESYTNYYLGPFVVSNKDGKKSIIDGQQRLTSLTLFLIFLNNLQKETGGSEQIEPLIFSERYGQKSFNIQVEDRINCLNSLFQDGYYDSRPEDDESTINLTERYSNISDSFPEEIKGKAFPYFLDWLKYNVILVEITAYSDDNAYAIFESMNDRGLNLTSTEMLKGYILSRFEKASEREETNKIWKGLIGSLREHSKDEDQQFFQVWLRSQYADTIRQSRAGSANEDFEKIGTRFHSWFRDSLAKIGLQQDSQDGFRKLVQTELKFFHKAYISILAAQISEKSGWEQVFYIKHWGIAPSLALPLMMSPLRSSDTDDDVRLKINVVARFVETFAVRRSINFRKFGASSIRYTMYTLVKEIRGLDVDSLSKILEEKIQQMEESWDGVMTFRMHGQNRRFVKFLLSRITAFIEKEAGSSNSFSTYYIAKGTKPFEVEHIWADKFHEHRDEFDQQHMFDQFRNRIGDLVLLPQGTNQSYGAMPYSEKVEHYVKENMYVQSLHEKTYSNNPNFVNMAENLEISFRPHTEFKTADIEARQNVVKEICKLIWDTKNDTKEMKE